MVPISDININYHGTGEEKQNEGPGTEAIVSTTNQKHVNSGAAGLSTESMKSKSKYNSSIVTNM